MDHKQYAHTEEEGFVQPVVDNRVHEDEPGDGGALGGRPADDRAIEVVEGGVGAAVGAAIGMVAGPLGAAVGAVVGGAIGVAAGEVLEHRAGKAATTVNAEETPAEAAAADETTER